MNQYVAFAIGFALVASHAIVYDAGKTAERNTWLDKESAELASANSAIESLESEIKEAHWAAEERLGAIAEQYEKEKQSEIEKRDRRIAELRTANFRLRDPGSKNTNGHQADGVTGSPSKCDGQEGGQLSNEASEFLLRITGEADEVVHQLTACQAVVLSDRNVEGEGK